MQESPATRASLLVRLRDGNDADAWQEFVHLYAPVIFAFARKRGLQDADAADLLQEVLRSVSSAVPRLEYDPIRGKFRAWLFTITRNKVFSFLEGRRRREQGSGDSGMQQRLEEHAGINRIESADWEADYQRSLIAQAMERIQGEFQSATWQAFIYTAIEGHVASQAAARFGLSVGAVYVAKSRVIARLRQEIERMQGDDP